MRMDWPTSAVVLVAAVFVSIGCDSSQPQHAGGTTASLTISATAKSKLFNCYDVWQDTSAPPDGIADVFTGFSTCEESTETFIRPAPWHYDLNISVIHAGSTVEATVTSLSGVTGSSVLPNDNVDDFVSMTDYDPSVLNAPAKEHQDDLYFLNGRQVSRGSPVFWNANGFPLEIPNLLTDPTGTFVFAVNSGDTIIVRARKQQTADSTPFLPSDPDPELTIAALLEVAGVPVTPVGSAASGTNDGSGFTFSYTVP